MGEPLAVSALIKKRAEISGEILRLEKEVRLRQTELLHLDATLRLFAPEVAVHSIKPKRVYRRHRSWFRNGERARLLFSVLRTAEQPLTTREITERIMVNKNIDPADLYVRDAIQKTVLALLNGSKHRGVILRIDGRRRDEVAWCIAPVVTPPCETAASSRRSQRMADCR